MHTHSTSTAAVVDGYRPPRGTRIIGCGSDKPNGTYIGEACGVVWIVWDDDLGPCIWVDGAPIASPGSGYWEACREFDAAHPSEVTA